MSDEAAKTRDTSQFRPEMEALIGRTMGGRYRVLGILGRGGNGYVFRARDQTMETDLALKVMPRELAADETHIKRFNKEALASSKLKHPNTIRVLDYGQTPDGYLFLAMELLEGRELSRIVKQGGPLDWRRALHIARQVAKSIAEAHQIGLVHRDLKPQNVFLCDFHGERDYVKVLDFGIAKFVEGASHEDAITQTGFICGTPGYIAPEQAMGMTVTPRTDLYALGVMLYEMLCGHPPFRAETAIATVMQHIHEPPPPLARHKPDLAIPAQLDGLVFSLLAKRAEDRPESAAALVTRIEGLLASGESAPHPEPRGAAATELEMPVARAVGPVTGETPRPLVVAAATSKDADTGAIPTAAQSPASGPAAPRSRAGWWAVATLAVAAGAAGVWLATKGPGGPASPPLAEPAPMGPARAEVVAGKAGAASESGTEAAPPRPSAAPSGLRVVLESTPVGAEVLDGDVLLGNTPVPVEIAAGVATRTVTLRLTGHQDRTVRLDREVLAASGQERMSVALLVALPNPAPTRERPPAAGGESAVAPAPADPGQDPKPKGNSGKKPTKKWDWE